MFSGVSCDSDPVALTFGCCCFDATLTSAGELKLIKVLRKTVVVNGPFAVCTQAGLTILVRPPPHFGDAHANSFRIRGYESIVRQAVASSYAARMA
jgi:hypothetical protein